MKLLKKDLKHGRLVVAVQNLDDLWHLSQVIEPGDLVSSRTTRKVKVTEKEKDKKTVFLELAAEAVEFKDQALRVNGKTTEEKEDIPKGAYHTISLEIGSTAGIAKDSWPKYQLKCIDMAARKQSRTLILVLDREEAVFALLKSKGYEILSQIKGKVAKKGVDSVTANFYRDLTTKLSDYFKRFRTDSIVVASPAFWKEDFMKELIDESLKKRIVLATCSSVSRNAIEELLKRPELAAVLKQQRAAEESRYVEQLMVEIGKDGLAAYGKKEIGNAVAAGNVKVLLITDVFIYRNRKDAEELMKMAEGVKAEVVIINSENEAGGKLDSLGGVAALTRYKAY
ncbi:mRNA surveillance protein pelota [Candidatus Woesearchaeota archaeon]|nr:mRNA surveillance protein pelota [Candidatus Woesearchaeota archaeon]